MLNVAKMPPLPTTTAVPVNPATKGSRKEKTSQAGRKGWGGGWGSPLPA